MTMIFFTVVIFEGTSFIKGYGMQSNHLFFKDFTASFYMVMFRFCSSYLFPLSLTMLFSHLWFSNVIIFAEGIFCFSLLLIFILNAEKYLSFSFITLSSSFSFQHLLQNCYVHRTTRQQCFPLQNNKLNVDFNNGYYYGYFGKLYHFLWLYKCSPTMYIMYFQRHKLIPQ